MERFFGRGRFELLFLRGGVMLSLRSIWREADVKAGLKSCDAREILRD
jgi:hypothetical protein